VTKKQPVPRPGKPYDTPIPKRTKWADRLNNRTKPTPEAEEAARRETEHPADETNEG
jgi:hypothetical protein